MTHSDKRMELYKALLNAFPKKDIASLANVAAAVFPDDTAPAPAIPDGWNSADVPPSGEHYVRNVEVMRANGKQLFACHDSEGVWYRVGRVYVPEMRDALYTGDAGGPGSVITDVISWRELPPEKPEPKFKVGDKVVVTLAGVIADHSHPLTENWPVNVEPQSGVGELRIWFSEDHITPA